MSTGSVTEIVTRAHVRDVVVPLVGHDPVRIALVTLDNGLDHRRPTTFGPGGLVALERALAGLRDRDDVDAVAITGKPFVFAVGADLSLLGGMSDHDEVRAVGALGHRVFGHLAEMDVPTFAFVNGAAMGGGLELALHCDHRTVSSDVRALSLPEVSLGIVPGWGGAWLLPQLVGPDRAVTVIVENPLAQNKQLDAATAVAIGLADVALEPADFLMMSLRWAADVVRGRAVVARPEVRRDAGAWAQAVARGRAVADARTHGAAPAPYRALDLIEAARESSRTDGFAAEDDALAELVLSPEAEASLYAFDLVQRRAKRPVGAPDPSLARPVTKVGVVGAGLMARQLALLTASRLGVPVVLLDKDESALDAGLDAVDGEITMLTERGVVDSDKANRLRALVSGSIDWSVFADCDLVIEAVFEDLDVKRSVFASLEAVVRDDCVIATNTSALSIAAMTEDVARPERFAGIHFFNPVAVLPLVEIVRTASTDDATLATAFAFTRGLGKSAVACADAPGFVVNRILTAFIQAAASAVDDGASPQEVEDAILGLGVPMGPFALVELVGPRVALHVGRTMAAAFPDRFAVSPTLEALAVGGASPVAASDPPVRTDDPASERIRTRALSAVATEVRAMLRDGVVADPRDIDLCMLLGAGWPFHLGGITPALRRRGLLDVTPVAGDS